VSILGALRPARRRREAITLALAALLGAVVVVLAGAVASPPAPFFRGFHPDALSADGKTWRWAREYSKVEITGSRWRPYRIAVRLRAPEDAAPRDLRVLLAFDDVPAAHLTVGTAPADRELIVRRPAAPRVPLTLQIYSEIDPASGRGVGVTVVGAGPVPLSSHAARLAGVGLALGALCWLLCPAGDRQRRRIARWSAPVSGQPALSVALLGLPVLAALIPLAGQWDPIRARYAAWLGLAILIAALVGLALRLLFERVSGRRAAAPFDDPVVDVAGGWLATIILVGVASFLAKRLLGLTALPQDLLAWTMLAAAAVALAASCRRGDVAHRLPRAEWSLTLAGFVGVVAWLAAPHLATLHAYSTDPDQHVAWTTQVLRQGLVPDRYLGTTAAIDYPLGFHTVMVALRSVTPLPAATLVVLTPIVTSTLFVFVVFRATRALHAAGAEDAAQRDAWAGRPLAEWVLAAALSAALASHQFSSWVRYEGTGRLAIGLLHVVPFLVGLGALTSRARCRRAAAAAGEAPGGAGVARFVAGVGLAVSLAITFTINPAHLWLQLLLSGAALVALRSMPSAGAPGAGSRLGAGLGCGLVLGAALVMADPVGYNASRAAAGLPVPDRDGGMRVRAAMNDAFRGRSCLSPTCLGRALSPPEVARDALEPLGVLTAGAIDAYVHGAAPPDPQVEPARRWRFPDITNLGYAPTHGIAPYAFAILLPLFVVMAARRASPVTRAVALILVLVVVDAGWRGVAQRLVDPADAALRLLPHYQDRGAAVLFAQTVWPMLAGALWAYLAWGRGARWRGWGTLVVVAAAAIVGASAHAALARESAVLQLARPVLHPDDLRHAETLEAQHVPEGESYLVSATRYSANGEEWILATDSAAPLYTHLARPTLFLYYLSHSAAVTPADFDATCVALHAGGRYPALLARHRARWAWAFTRDGHMPEQQVRARQLCGRPFETWFPDLELVARAGTVALYRLW
jgi:hypothetical protein